MVRGMNKFRTFFAEFTNNYVIIGGTACDFYEEQYGQEPRATKDIDIILVVEALSTDFVSRFWEFVKAGGYTSRQKGEGKHEYYRFLQPEEHDFPYQVELFSRNLGLLDFPDDAHLTPIPMEDDLSSLSAILMDDDYYNFTIEHSLVEDGIHFAGIESLICLKARAFREMTERKLKDGTGDSKHIAKHKKDVFRLIAMLAAEDHFEVPESLKDDLRVFCELTVEELPTADFFKSIGLTRAKGENFLLQLKQSFILE